MDTLGHIDIACLPIGGKFTMDISEAVEAAKAIRPRMVIAMHRLKADPNEFERQLVETTSVQVAPLGIGETIRLS
jgi:L-ascorbate metabolism protein UlaG (beta-lactamase superfamily)